VKNWENTLLPPTASIRDAIKTIESGSFLVALIVDVNKKLLGLVTDGDIRRAILKGKSLDLSVTEVMNASPKIISSNASYEAIVQQFQQSHYRHLPIVDENNILLGIKLLDDLHQTLLRNNWVVIMAGGLGSRLGELTANCPKPLLKVGDKPILETIIEKFIEQGFQHFFISVNYKADMIEDYFEQGEKWGVEIKYIREKERLGTGGALSLLSETPNYPIIVMNGDVLTRVNFQMLLDFHNEQKAIATMCVREYDFQVPFGVVNINNNTILSVDEKPIHSFFVNAGIYVLSPESLECIPKQKHFNLPDLFENLAKENQKTIAFPIREYWLDVGQVDDFKQANGDYQKVFK
jgi:dTDP-glucose pyrophosphorylase